MKIIDLTYTINENMPVYPGSEKPKLTPVSEVSTDGFKETNLEMFSHTGTHMDAPNHIFADGITLDKINSDKFVGKALVIDASDVEEGKEIDFSYIQKNKEKADEAEFLIFKTGWEKYWGEEKYFANYPVISAEIADYMVKSKKKGIGLDTISVDSIDDYDLKLHNKILGEGNMVIIENLCNLDLLGENIFTFVALPLKYENADGAPTRAIGML